MDKQQYTLPEKCDRQPFEVPEHFFEDFQASLSRHIDEIEADSNDSSRNHPVIRINWREKLKPYLYFAAMFVLMFFTVKGIMGIRDDRQQELALKTLDVEETDTDEITAEDILMSELDSYNIMYYLYGEE